MRKIIFAAAAVVAVAATPAFAQSATNTMQVSVAVIDSCTISATALDFGSPTAIGGTNIDATSTLTLTCTTGADYDVWMGFGNYAASGQRNMAGAAVSTNRVPYNVYSNSARTTAWGNTSGTDTVAGTAASGLPFTLTAYGRIPSTAAAVPADVYSDTVTVTVNF